MPDPELKRSAYDGLFPPGLHLFVTRGVESILSNFRPEEVKWRAIIQEYVDLEWFAKKNGAKDLSYLLDWFPSGGLKFIHWKKMNYAFEIKEYGEDPFSLVFKEEIYRFDGPVYAGNILVVNQEYGNLIPIRCSFVAAPEKSMVDHFRKSYLEADRERRKRVLNHSGFPVSSFRPMKWDDIFLDNGMAERIKNSCKSFFKGKSLYAKHNVDWRLGMLFMGPPGNGKTAVCRAIATNTEVPIIYCSLSDADVHSILASLPGTIRNNAPCVLMIEDVDAMAETNAMRAGFLNIMDGLTGESGVLTIASTNCPEKLDPAFSSRPSRFDELYFFDNPTEQMRKAILSKKLGKRLKDKQIAQLAKKASGLSAAFVQEVAVKAIRDSFLNGNPISEKALSESLKRVRKHFSDSSKDWNGRIGFSSDPSNGRIDES